MRARVSGLFHSDNAEFDSKYVLIPIETSREILGYEQNMYSSLDIKLHSPYKTEDTDMQIEKMLGGPFKCAD